MTIGQKLKTALLASAAALALAAPAAAQNVIAGRMAYMCTYVSYCAYDTAGNVLGVLQQVNVIWRQVGNWLYFAGYTSAGFTVDAALYSLKPDCSGDLYQASGYIEADLKSVTPNGPPGWAQWDGTNFWAPFQPAQIVAPKARICYGVGCDNGDTPGVCEPYKAIIAYGYPAFAPTTITETPKIAKPTATCIANQNCVVIK